MATPEPEQARGPAVHVVAAYPADGEGAACDDAADCGVPTNATLSLRFDRFLNPATANRQAIRVYSGDPEASSAIPFHVSYDPVERVVQYRMPAGYSFEPNALYQFELVVPQGSDDFGFRAFDGAPLEERDVPLRSSFFTGEGPVEYPQLVAPTCADIVEQVFEARPANCAASSCHSGVRSQNGTPHGLWLDGRSNVRVTAINRVARQTELGDRSGGVPLEQAARFGVRMPLIQPGNPGNSYLLYKLLRGQGSYEPCAEEADPDPLRPSSTFCSQPADACVSAYPELPFEPGSCVAPSDAERERLREWFVRGEEMPIARPENRHLGLQQLRAVSSFIAGGADCSE